MKLGAIGIVCVSGDQIIEQSEIFDGMGMMQQLVGIPAQG